MFGQTFALCRTLNAQRLTPKANTAESLRLKAEGECSWSPKSIQLRAASHRLKADTAGGLRLRAEGDYSGKLMQTTSFKALLHNREVHIIKPVALEVCRFTLGEALSFGLHCRFTIVDSRLSIHDCRFTIADSRLPFHAIADWPSFAYATAGKDCRLFLL